MMKRRLAALTVMVTLALGGSLIAAVPAEAHFLWGCNHGSACVFTGYNGSGSKYTICWSCHPKDTCINLPVSFQNNASSLVADFGSGWDVRWWENANCSDFWGGDYQYSPSSWSLDGDARDHLDNDIQSYEIVDDL